MWILTGKIPLLLIMIAGRSHDTNRVKIFFFNFFILIIINNGQKL